MIVVVRLLCCLLVTWVLRWFALVLLAWFYFRVSVLDLGVGF